jgi:hypothetical protein
VTGRHPGISLGWPRAAPDEKDEQVPFAFVFESEMVGQDDYDELMKALGRESVDAPVPDGVIAHLSGPKQTGGWQVIDVWESEEAAKEFYGSEQFNPVTSAAESVGIMTTPWPLYRTEVERRVKRIG